MLYFAYGSNMSTPRLGERVSISSTVGVATLFDHTLRFQKVSVDGSAKCDIEERPESDAEVHGVVFELPDPEIEVLNEVEGLGNGYDSKIVSVSLFDGQVVEALTYWATIIDKNLKPYHWYKHHVLYGAKEASLPNSYVSDIEAIVSVDDPQPDREHKQMLIYR
ncbi:MAG: gamma-glutamylcyclotransferase [Pseudomonadales bacterium]|nr:gamma-glutamylcyclotransferase [Pseudomonadales bacterium]